MNYRKHVKRLYKSVGSRYSRSLDNPKLGNPKLSLVPKQSKKI